MAEKDNRIILGIDIGGTGIKGGLIDIKKGKFVSDRYRLETPQPATPEAVAATFTAIVRYFNYNGPIGVGFPAIVHNGVALSAANIDETWMNVNIDELLTKASGCEVDVINDADAAGIASMRYGVGRGKKGVVIMLTIGTGIGSALFINKTLVPNSEMGHLYLAGHTEIAEKYCSSSARNRLGLSWEEWGSRFSEYLRHIDFLFSPDLIILGGGDSKYFEEYKQYLPADLPIVPAGLQNKAGSIGAAYHASKRFFQKKK